MFANLVLADEINRAPAKVQVCIAGGNAGTASDIGGRDIRIADTFLVLATQNPVNRKDVSIA